MPIIQAYGEIYTCKLLLRRTITPTHSLRSEVCARGEALETPHLDQAQWLFKHVMFFFVSCKKNLGIFMCRKVLAMRHDLHVAGKKTHIAKRGVTAPSWWRDLHASW
ncbi:hypothetical protein ACJQWK_10278 [Exserohilum turcicum]